ncbi:MAG: nitrogenase [Thermales bacterium]|nr:nitrogenase [Thermales bacterium]
MKTRIFNPIVFLFTPVNYVLENFPIRSVWWARLICKLIPSHCPFEREVKLMGKQLHIPPLCKLNPVYNGLVTLKFHSLELLERNDTTRICI